jgi:uncharacterized protein (DUF1697 family)
MRGQLSDSAAPRSRAARYGRSVPVIVVLLRGINLGSRNRVSMPELRGLLEDAGYADVRTYLQSGNAVVSTRKSADRVARDVEQLLEDHVGLEIAVVTRTRDELARIVRRNPLGEAATDPKRYQVSFLSRKLDAATAGKLRDLAAPTEKVVVSGREVFAWHPAGVARSKLWTRLAGRDLGVTATSRNWTTVESLLELASG